MYSSTCVPRSKLKSQNKDESSDDSLTDGESDHHVRCNEGLDDRGCPSLSDDRNLQPDAGAYSGGADDHTVPSASQQVDNIIMEDDDNFAGIRLRLSATTQYTGVSSPTQNKHREKEDNVWALAKDHRELIPNHGSHSNSLGTGTCTPQSTHQQDRSSIYPIAVGDSATNAEGMHKNCVGHISYPSVENLSELIKDMSVGDDNIATGDHSSPAHDQNPSKCEHSVRLEKHEGTRPPLPPSCTSTSSSCDCKLNKLEVTTFNPHSASTPFRDQHLRNTDQSCDSDPRELSTATCTVRVAVTPGHLEEQEMSVLVRETPEHLWCSPNLPNVETHGAECDSEQSYRVSESIFQSAGLKSFCNDLNRAKLPPRQASCELSDIDMTTFNNFDNTDSSRTTMGHSCSDSSACVHVTFMDPTLPPTQDFSHSNEGEWSILAKQTPTELWDSPVVKVVDDSLNST